MTDRRPRRIPAPGGQPSVATCAPRRPPLPSSPAAGRRRGRAGAWGSGSVDPPQPRMASGMTLSSVETVTATVPLEMAEAAERTVELTPPRVDPEARREKLRRRGPPWRGRRQGRPPVLARPSAVRDRSIVIKRTKNNSCMSGYTVQRGRHAKRLKEEIGHQKGERRGPFLAANATRAEGDHGASSKRLHGLEACPRKGFSRPTPALESAL